MLERVDDWRTFLLERFQAEQADLLRRHEQTGRPLGNLKFIKQLEHALGRMLRLNKPRRKKKRLK